MISNISNINSHRMSQMYIDVMFISIYVQVYHLSTKIANLHIHREPLRYLIFCPLTFSKQLPFSERRAVPKTCLDSRRGADSPFNPPGVPLNGEVGSWDPIQLEAFEWCFAKIGGAKGCFFRLGFATWPCQNHRSIPIAAWLLMHHGRMTCSTANGGSRLCLTFKKTWRWSDKWMLRCVDS